MPKLLCVLIHLTFTTPFDFLELFIYNEKKEAKKPKSVDIAKVKLLRGASFFYGYFGYFHGNGISSNNSFLSCLLMNFDFFLAYNSSLQYFHGNRRVGSDFLLDNISDINVL